ncbi:MAG TPA: Lrp/AsnC family transcriptional regulator [Anaerolineae bacterium]|nr:Lrp/AsnC family transcriptional regulator [Anaerolineae bacterium]
MSIQHKLDKIDFKILDILQREGRISNAELARRIDLSQPATHARLKRLEQSGIIQAYMAILDREKLGFEMLCFVHVTLEKHQPDWVKTFHARVLEMPEVVECYHVTGDFDYLLKVVMRQRRDLEGFLVDKLSRIPGVGRVHTSVVLREVKETYALPLLTEDQQG